MGSTGAGGAVATGAVTVPNGCVNDSSSITGIGPVTASSASAVEAASAPVLSAPFPRASASRRYEPVPSTATAW